MLKCTLDFATRNAEERLTLEMLSFSSVLNSAVPIRFMLTSVRNTCRGRDEPSPWDNSDRSFQTHKTR